MYVNRASLAEPTAERHIRLAIMLGATAPRSSHLFTQLWTTLLELGWALRE
jgi:hypothetical protein